MVSLLSPHPDMSTLEDAIYALGPSAEICDFGFLTLAGKSSAFDGGWDRLKLSTPLSPQRAGLHPY